MHPLVSIAAAKGHRQPTAVGETRSAALAALRPGLAFYAGFFPRYNQLMAAHWLCRRGRGELRCVRSQAVPDRRQGEVEAAMKVVASEFAEAVPDAFAGDGVAFLQTVYKDPRLPLSIRMDAAAKAARPKADA